MGGASTNDRAEVLLPLDPLMGGACTNDCAEASPTRVKEGGDIPHWSPPQEDKVAFTAHLKRLEAIEAKLEVSKFPPPPPRWVAQSWPTARRVAPVVPSWPTARELLEEMEVRTCVNLEASYVRRTNMLLINVGEPPYVESVDQVPRAIALARACTEVFMDLENQHMENVYIDTEALRDICDEEMPRILERDAQQHWSWSHTEGGLSRDRREAERFLEDSSWTLAEQLVTSGQPNGVPPVVRWVAEVRDCFHMEDSSQTSDEEGVPGTQVSEEATQMSESDTQMSQSQELDVPKARKATPMLTCAMLSGGCTQTGGEASASQASMEAVTSSPARLPHPKSLLADKPLVPAPPLQRRPVYKYGPGEAIPGWTRLTMAGNVRDYPLYFPPDTYVPKLRCIPSLKRAVALYQGATPKSEEIATKRCLKTLEHYLELVTPVLKSRKVQVTNGEFASVCVNFFVPGDTYHGNWTPFTILRRVLLDKGRMKAIGCFVDTDHFTYHDWYSWVWNPKDEFGHFLTTNYGKGAARGMYWDDIIRGLVSEDIVGVESMLSLRGGLLNQVRLLHRRVVL